MAEVDEVVRAFKCWDTVGSGVITTQGLRGLIAALTPGILEDDLDLLFEAAAEDGVRLESLKYEEFIQWLWTNNTPEGSAAGQEGASDSIWADELASASTKAMEQYPAEKVRSYFGEVSARLQSDSYREHVKGAFFDAVADREGHVSFEDAAPLIGKCLQCAADLAQSPARPSAEEVRAEFDAHDAGGCGKLTADEFLGLMRHLQTKVAGAALALSSAMQEG